MLYLCILNATAVGFFAWVFQWMPIWCLVVVGVGAFLWQFWTATAWAHKEDETGGEVWSKHLQLPSPSGGCGSV